MPLATARSSSSSSSIGRIIHCWPFLCLELCALGQPTQVGIYLLHSLCVCVCVLCVCGATSNEITMRRLLFSPFSFTVFFFFNNSFVRFSFGAFYLHSSSSAAYVCIKFHRVCSIFDSISCYLFMCWTWMHWKFNWMKNARKIHALCLRRIIYAH